ncbi:unnamed protein product [Orchesella dallaii]|uniref:G-patch domain-containing protein n=1 Tax=Orchesella dallaii TaxID=48710 RepID=A0ABP1R8G4_9HEXA
MGNTSLYSTSPNRSACLNFAFLKREGWEVGGCGIPTEFRQRNIRGTGDYRTARELEKRAEVSSNLEATDGEKTKQRRKSSKQKKPCLALVKDRSSDEANSDDSLITSVSNVSIDIPSDQEFNVNSRQCTAPSKLSVIPSTLTDNNLLTNINLVRTNTHASLPFMNSSEAAGNSAESPITTPVPIDFDSLVYDEPTLISLVDCPLQQTHVPRQPLTTLPEQSSVSSSTFASLFSRQIAFEKQVLTALTGIKADVRELLQRSGSNVMPEDALTGRLPFDLPLQTIDSLMKLNDWAAVSDNYKELMLFDTTEGLKALPNAQLKHQFKTGFEIQGIWRAGINCGNKMSSYRSKRRQINLEVAQIINTITVDSGNSEISKSSNIIDNFSTTQDDNSPTSQNVIFFEHNNSSTCKNVSFTEQDSPSVSHNISFAGQVDSHFATFTEECDSEISLSILPSVGIGNLQINTLSSPLISNLKEEISNDFSSSLAKWSIDNNINHTAVSSLLKILKPNMVEPTRLPSILLRQNTFKNSKGNSIDQTWHRQVLLLWHDGQNYKMY